MDRLRIAALASLALALAAPSGRADEKSASDDRTCVLYSLVDLVGNDPSLGQWVADTIPEVVAPGTWKYHGGEGVLRYYAPKNLLVVSHTAATQAKVEDFLKNVKKSLPAGHDKTRTAAKAQMHDSAVVPADYRVPGPTRACSSFAEQSSSYPVPAPVARPKHLFHFIIRYEGEGIVDDNVVKAIKTQFQANKKEKASLAGPSYYPGSASGSAASSVPGERILAPSSGVPSSSGSEKKDKDDKKADKDDKKKADKDEEKDDKTP
jgi:hypothetical protein